MKYLVDFPCGDVVVFVKLDVQEAFIVPQV